MLLSDWFLERQEKRIQAARKKGYAHNTATQKNNPRIGIAAQGKIKETPKQEYAYTPHQPRNLRFNIIRKNI